MGMSDTLFDYAAAEYDPRVRRRADAPHPDAPHNDVPHPDAPHNVCGLGYPAHDRAQGVAGRGWARSRVACSLFIIIHSSFIIQSFIINYSFIIALLVVARRVLTSPARPRPPRCCRRTTTASPPSMCMW
jgi:hypothetical protein